MRSPRQVRIELLPQLLQEVSSYPRVCHMRYRPAVPLMMVGLVTAMLQPGKTSNLLPVCHIDSRLLPVIGRLVMLRPVMSNLPQVCHMRSHPLLLARVGLLLPRKRRRG